MQQIWHIDSGRLLLRTPDPVSFGLGMCSTYRVQSIFQNCHYCIKLRVPVGIIFTFWTARCITLLTRNLVRTGMAVTIPYSVQ